MRAVSPRFRLWQEVEVVATAEPVEVGGSTLVAAFRPEVQPV